MRQPYEYSQQGYQVYDGWAIIVEAIGSVAAAITVDHVYHPDPANPDPKDTQPVPPGGSAQFITYAGDLAIHTLTIPVNRGTVSSVSVHTDTAGVVRGQIFVRIKIGYQITATPFIVATLAADYLTTFTPIQFPGTGIYQSTQGTGNVVLIPIGAAGLGVTPLTITIPVNSRWQIHEMRFDFESSAVAGNRYGYVDFNAVDTFKASVLQPAIPASTNTCFTLGNFGCIMPSYTAGVTIVSHRQDFSPIPAPLILRAANTINYIIQNIDGGDLIAGGMIRAEQWIDI